jgi:tetratricopeptide (TPR) repeat protein
VPKRQRNGSSTPQRTLNVRLLVVSLVTFVVLAGAACLLHGYQLSRLRGSLLVRADQLEQEEKWSEAAGYLQRYLRLDPQNPEILGRVARTYDRSADTRSRKTRAVELYYRAVGMAPQDQALRVRLAELLLELERYAAARTESEAVLSVTPDHEGCKAAHALALCGLSRMGLVPLEQALAEVRNVAGEQPGNAALVEALVRICREDRPRRHAVESNRLADEAVERLVSTRPNDSDVHLVRSRYRSRYGLPGAEQDLQQALKLTPTDPDVLLAAARSAMDRDQPEEAADLYERLLKIAPGNDAACLGLGETYARRGDQTRAVEIWQRGRLLHPNNLLLAFRLAEALVQQDQFVEAESALDAVDQALSRLAGLQTVEALQTLRVVRPAADLLRARWHLGQGRPTQAVSLLRRVGLTGGDPQFTGVADAIPLQAWLLLGAVYAQQGMWDQSAFAYEQAAEISPTALNAQLGAAAARAASGQLDAAIWHCQQLLAEENPPREAWVEFARLQYRRQLTLVPGQRDWSVVEQSMASAREAYPDSWQLDLIRADVVAARQQEGADDGSVVAILKAAEEAYPKVEDLWAQLAYRYERLNRSQDAQRAIDRFEELTADPFRRSMVRAQWLAYRGELAEAREHLGNAYRLAEGAQRDGLVLVLAELHHRLGRPQDADRLLREYLESKPGNLSAMGRLADMALEASDYAQVEQWEDRLRELEGPDGCNWKLLRARRLLDEASSTDSLEFQQARQLQSEIKSARPS